MIVCFKIQNAGRWGFYRICRKKSVDFVQNKQNPSKTILHLKKPFFGNEKLHMRFELLLFYVENKGNLSKLKLQFRKNNAF